MVFACLPSDALSQHLPSYLGFSYLGRGVSLHSCSSKVQWLLLTLGNVAPPDLEHGVAPLCPPAPMQWAPWTWLLSATIPDLGRGVVPLHCSCAVTTWHSGSPPLTLGVG